MGDVIDFYENKLALENGASYTNVLNWEDSEFENGHIFWIFSSKNITENEWEIFRTNKKIRKRVIALVVRILDYYGFSIRYTKPYVVKNKPLKRLHNGESIGLYSTRNYKRIINIIQFLQKIDMQLLAFIVYTAVALAIKEDPELKKKIKDRGYYEQLKNFEGLEKPGEEKQEDCTLQGLSWVGNSCYQDSALVCLLAIPNQYITRYILRKDIDSLSNKKRCGSTIADHNKNIIVLQNELDNLAQFMRGETENKSMTCTNLRRVISACSPPEPFHKQGMHDSGEYLNYLFMTFDFEPIVRYRATFLTNDLGSSSRLVKSSESISNSSPIIHVTSGMQEGKKELDIRQVIDSEEDTVLDKDNLFFHNDSNTWYARRIERNTIISAPYAVFNIQKNYIDLQTGRELQTTTIINFPQKMKIQEDKISLFGIVIHKNAHYTCFIKCKNQWVFYNDIPSPSFQKVDFDSVQNIAGKYGTLFFYSK